MPDKNCAAGPSGPSMLSRRCALAAGLTMPLAVRATAGPVAAAARLTDRAALANAAFMRGDMESWRYLIGPIAPDFTLMQPFGGPASHGFDSSSAHLADLAHYFRNGVTTQELVRTYSSEDLIVLVLIERQRGEVGGLPDQDWSLRVTQVYRRRGDAWEYVHRHADPLVRNIGLERTAALARG